MEYINVTHAPADRVKFYQSFIGNGDGFIEHCDELNSNCFGKIGDCNACTTKFVFMKLFSIYINTIHFFLKNLVKKGKSL